MMAIIGGPARGPRRRPGGALNQSRRLLRLSPRRNFSDSAVNRGVDTYVALAVWFARAAIRSWN